MELGDRAAAFFSAEVLQTNFYIFIGLFSAILSVFVIALIAIIFATKERDK